MIFNSELDKTSNNILFDKLNRKIYLKWIIFTGPYFFRHVYINYSMGAVPVHISELMGRHKNMVYCNWAAYLAYWKRYGPWLKFSRKCTPTREFFSVPIFYIECMYVFVKYESVVWYVLHRPMISEGLVCAWEKHVPEIWIGHGRRIFIEDMWYLNKFFQRSDLIWNDGLLIDFLQKKSVDLWVRKFVIYTGFIFSERFLFESIIYLFPRTLLLDLAKLSTFENNSVLTILTNLIYLVTSLLLTLGLYIVLII